jgi:outer membrane biosynthesis protein TonB
MKIILTILFIFGGGEFEGNVSQFNQVKKEAEFAYNNEDYSTAVERYRYLIDSLKYQDDNARLNLAHSHYKMDEIDQAKALYSSLSTSTDKEVRSIANQQLGVFESRGQNLEKALNYFKKSLLANPENEDARYNYELVKKKLEEQEQQNQENQQDQKDKQEDQKDQDKKDQEKKEQQNQEQQQNKDQENKQDQQQQKEQEQQQENKEQQEQQEGEKQNENEEQQQPQPSQPDFEEKEISKEMAEMILQAMRNKELQYLQQMKRKPTKPADKDKPDW